MKTIITNPVFYWFLILYLMLSAVGNSIKWAADFHWLGMLPIVIAVVLLFLLFTWSGKAKLALQAWAVLGLMMGGTILLGARLYRDMGAGFAEVDILAHRCKSLTLPHEKSPDHRYHGAGRRLSRRTAPRQRIRSPRYQTTLLAFQH